MTSEAPHTEISLGGKRFASAISKKELHRIYDADTPPPDRDTILGKMGPLQSIFTAFVENERHVKPLDDQILRSHFARCGDSQQSIEELSAILYDLAPGNRQIGYRQVITLTELLQEQVAANLKKNGSPADLVEHDHAFGSGGDLCKTIHATTTAAIVVAPEVRICKTGTLNVTSHHGSSQVMDALGYNDKEFDNARVNEQLERFGFAFVSLSTLGFPYSDNLREARRRLWNDADHKLRQKFQKQTMTWQEVVRSTQIPLDIFKIISPNAQVLSPRHHCTGVCHPSMLPYVLGIYLHFGTEGMIVYSYDGIDEIANASTNMTPNAPNTVMIKVEPDRILISEFAPEDLGLRRATMDEIEEKEDLAVDTDIIWHILNGEEQGAKRDFILANAGMIIAANRPIVGMTDDDLVGQIQGGIDIARKLINDGTSARTFHALLRWRQEQQAPAASKS
jgi:anthranilate phosphoribosyltransferase